MSFVKYAKFLCLSVVVLSLTACGGGNGDTDVVATVAATNQAPVATAQTITVDEDTSNNVITLTATDADSDTLTYTIVTQPSNGALAGTTPNVTYTPAANFAGTDSFSFKVNDGTVDSATAIISIAVTDIAEPNEAPVATAQTITVYEDSSNNVITLAGTDADNDDLLYSVGDGPSNGTLAGSAPNVIYTPDVDFYGVDSFSFSIFDGNAYSTNAVVSISVLPVGTSPLNDTGITLCADDSSIDLDCSVTVSTHPNQDADSGRDVTHNDDSDGHAGFSFTKISSTGVELAATATDWSCVKDNVTGLIWEVKTDDGGIHDKDNTYTWYNPDSSNNGGNAGTENGDNDTESFVDAVNTDGLCGTSDWRLPAREELRSIVSYDRANPPIDNDYFPNTISSIYWSSSPYAYDSRYAWIVNFGYGGDYASYKYNYGYVRLVRSGQ